MEHSRYLITVVLLLIAMPHRSLAFSRTTFLSSHHVRTKYSSDSIEFRSHASRESVALSMGLFDGIFKAFSNQEYSKAFSNQDFKAQDRRVRASHILIKGDDVGEILGKIKQLKGELDERVQQEDQLQPVFSELARRESQCPSRDQGGDLGLFGAGKMVKEFDDVLFPREGVAPPVGSVLGPIVTEFGCHVILVTQREENRDQVEEKLARND